MSTLSSAGRRTPSGPWPSSITAGSTGRPCTPSCPPSRTSASPAAGSTRWESVPEEVSATSCTCDPYPETSGGSSTGGGRGGTGHLQGPIWATIPEKGTVGIFQTTAMAASETRPLPFTQGHRCSWPGPLLRTPSLSSPILPQAP